MLIFILNSNFRKSLLVRQYTFAQYVEEFRGLGSFKLQMPYDSQNKAVITRNVRYVLFESGDGRDVIGKIEKTEYTSDIDSDREIVVSGRLMQYIFDKRVVKGTAKFKGYVHTYIKKLIQENMIESEDENRNIKATVYYSNATLLENKSMSIDTQQTGGTVWDEINGYLESNRYGIIIRPNIVPLQEIDNVETNVDGFKIIISCGRDLTPDNTDGNVSVIFSQGMSNIYRTEYQIERESHCTVAYTAGEDTGTERKWYELKPKGYGDTSGFNRLELWIDARDIQSEDEEGNKLTDEQYDKKIKDRTSEKFTEHEINTTYSGTIKAIGDKYVYNKHFYLGDTVFIYDSDLGLALDAQVVSVTTSLENNKKNVDIDFCYGKIVSDINKQLKKLNRQAEENKTAIKALQNKK